MNHQTLRLLATPLTAAAIPLTALLIGCALPSTRGAVEASAVRPVMPTRAMSPRTVIDGVTLATAGAGSVYDALLKLRPEVLYRVASTPNAPTGASRDVYIDGRFFGDIRELRQIPVAEVLELRLLTPVEAALMFGKKSAVGVIALRTR